MIAKRTAGALVRKVDRLLETEIREKVPYVEVLTHLEPLLDPRSWEDGKP